MTELGGLAGWSCTLLMTQLELELAQAGRALFQGTRILFARITQLPVPIGSEHATYDMYHHRFWSHRARQRPKLLSFNRQPQRNVYVS